jgi:hypothetical protein
MQSDAFCKISTGGGFATRKLYADDDESIINVVRPGILTGISDFVIRSDLVDRSLLTRLSPIPAMNRREQEELEAAFVAARPKILGGLLDMASHGLKMLPQTHLAELPRMADFAKWASACETALWPTGAFMKAYARNRADADETVIEADEAIKVLRDFMSARMSWVGTADQSLSALVPIAGEKARAKSWPQNSRVLSSHMRRAAPNLRRLGVDIAFKKSVDRLITISSTPPGA